MKKGSEKKVADKKVTEAQTERTNIASDQQKNIAEAKAEAKARLRERKARINELKQKRLREVSQRYKESKEHKSIVLVK